MSEQLYYSQLIHRLRVEGFKNNGFTTHSQYTRESGSLESNWNWQVENIRPINFFIGPNNSGKSRLLRFLLTSDIEVIDSDTLPVWDIIDNLDNPQLDRQLSVNCRNNGYNSHSAKKIKQIFYNKLPDKVSIQKITSLLVNTTQNELNLNSTPYGTEFLDTIYSFHNKEVKSFLEKYSSQSFRKTYIPLLRGLRTLSDKDVYLERTLQDYFSNKGFKSNNGGNKNDVLNIFTGHTLYEDLKKALLGDHQQRQSVKDYENFLSMYFFDNDDIALVPRIFIEDVTGAENNVVHIKIGERQERAIYDLGDGLQTVIMLTVQAFLTNEPTMFFIEEPEQNVHAGLQRSIIEAFRLRPQHMFFMTTHSNHFVDLAQEYDDVSLQQIYQQVVGSDETTVVESSEVKMQLLDSLGVRASSVLTANCSIWVEGITDKLYLRVYLEKFVKELEQSNEPNRLKRAEKLRHYKENLHYLFTEYQGSNITHWDFDDAKYELADSTPAKKLNSKILLLADGDITNKAERVDTLRESLDDNFHLLDWKEIENYIPQHILVEAAEKRWKTFQKRQEFKFNSQNILSKPGHFERHDKGVGEILEGFVRKQDNSPKKADDKDFFREKSGTIKDKMKFCHTAVDIMKNNSEWNLTPQLKKLCNSIWTHIENSN